MDGAENGAPKPKGSVPEFGGFGENNAGFTGMFEVKKKARREQQDELDFPEPLEAVAFDEEEERRKKEKKKKPKSSAGGAGGKGKKKKKKKKGGEPEQGCCTIL